MNSVKPATATLLNKIRRAARDLARDTRAGISYTTALDQLAREAGYASWRAATSAAASSAAARSVGKPSDGEGSELPVDPELPADFNNTPNESRSEAELDTWWMRPFAVSRPDGRLDVRCLDGGAHDRSTWWGTADDLEQARVIARRGLERAQEMHDTVSGFLLDEYLLLTVSENRPGMPRPVLRVCELNRAKACREEWEQLLAQAPSHAAAVIKAARARTHRLPTEQDLVAAEAFRRRVHIQRLDGAEPEYEEWLVLVTLLKLAAGGTLEFALPELRYYLSAWWGGNDTSTWEALRAAVHLHARDKPPIVRSCEVKLGDDGAWQALPESEIALDGRLAHVRVALQPDAAERIRAL